MNNNPLLLYQNQLVDAYSMVAGVEQSGVLFPESQVWDSLRPWIVTPDAAGAVTVQLDFNAIPDIGFLNLGAHRHDSSGFRFDGGTVQLQYWNGAAFADCVAATAITAGNTEPSLHEVAAHAVVVNGGVYSYKLTLSGFTPLVDISLPQLYLGPGLEMPYLTYGSGFDPLLEEWKGPKVTTETGRVYESALSQVYIPRAQWPEVPIASGKAAEVEAFRENHIESREPFWWFWAPVTAPRDGFLVKHDGVTAPFPHVDFDVRSFTLAMREYV